MLKQFVRRIDGRRALKRWLKQNQGEKCAILTFAIPPFLVSDIVKLARRYNVKCYAIVTDLLRDMYMNENNSLLISKSKQLYLRQAIRYQSEYDAYVYLTKEMSEVINPLKPYVVVEGIADLRYAKKPDVDEKSTPVAIMYAGMLHKNYGILNLVEAFCQLKKDNIELWLFGDGNCVSEIKDYCKLNENIKYFGNVAHDKVLEYERKATLLINVRDPADSFTKYSFPSKTIEYMLSGTPLLTTKLKGIPSEYFDYLFLSPDNSVKNLSLAISDAFLRTDDEMRMLGENAKRFITEQKNAKKQTARILDFLHEVNDETIYR